MKRDFVAGRERWRVRSAPAVWRRLHEELDLPPFTARVLAARGFTEPEAVRRFLSPTLDQLHDPFLMPGIPEAVDRLLNALRSGEKIRIYGDYDVDGVTGTAVLCRALVKLGGHFDYYIPQRLSEGYGLSREGLERADAEGVSLVVTVDTGISAVKEIAYAATLGLEVIVTDHHSMPDELPPALALVHPRRPGSRYPFPQLSGVGVSFKLGQGLLERAGQPSWVEELDLVALGTLADFVPLVDENRVFVKIGLERLNGRQRPGIAALAEVSGLAEREINATTIAFQLAPRINAVGRIGDPAVAVDLLVSDSTQQAGEAARQMDAENRARQAIERTVLAEALHQVETQVDLEEERVLVLHGHGWHPGVVGIVAARLVERFHRPALVAGEEEGRCVGSARSVDGFDIHAAMSRCTSLFERFGGHPQAAGFTLPVENMPHLRQGLNRVAREEFADRPSGDGRQAIEVDGELCLEELDRPLVDSLQALAPFGEGNPQPLLLIRGAVVAGIRLVGRTRNHLKLLLADGPTEGREKVLPTGPLDAIGFDLGAAAPVVESAGRIDVVGYAEVNLWRERERLQVRLVDLCPAAEVVRDFWPRFLRRQTPLVEAAHPDRQLLALVYLLFNELTGGESAPLPPESTLSEALVDRLAPFIQRRSMAASSASRASPPSAPMEEEAAALLLRAALPVFYELGLVRRLGSEGAGQWLFCPPEEQRLSLEESPAYQKVQAARNAWRELLKAAEFGLGDPVSEARLDEILNLSRRFGVV